MDLAKVYVNFQLQLYMALLHTTYNACHIFMVEYLWNYWILTWF